MVASSDQRGRRAVRASEFTVVCAILNGVIAGSKLGLLPFELRCRWLTTRSVGFFVARRRSARAHAFFPALSAMNGLTQDEPPVC